MPKEWRGEGGIAHQVRYRDRMVCRRCGYDVGWAKTKPQINHIIPRRIAPDLIVRLDNLALLCGECHAWATMTLEPKLYAGDVQAFQRFLDVLKMSGPIPDADMLARAYQTIRELAFG